MLPFYTIALSTEDFGVADLVMSTALLLIPIFTLGVSDGCMRFAIDKSYDNTKVFSIGFIIVTGGILLLICLVPVLRMFTVIKNYIFYLFVFYIIQAYNHLFGYFARGIDKVRIVGISGVASSFLAVLFNILFLFVFKMGLVGYLLSFIIAFSSSTLILFFGAKLYKYIKLVFDIHIAKDILNYSLPLVPNSLSWWLNDTANRYIIGYYCSVGDVGLYSASSRLPSIVNTFRSIFIQAWQLSTITEYDKQDSISFFSNIFRAYHFFIIVLVSVCIVFSKILGRFLLSNDFFNAWIFTPFLFLGVLFGALVAFYSPTYLAQKKTKKLLLSTVLGAVIAVAGNFILVPIMGALGAAIMSALSYFIIYLYLHVDSMKYLTYRTIYFRYYLSYALIALQAVLITFFSVPPTSLWSILIFILIIAINNQDIVLYLDFAKQIIRKIWKKKSKLQ